MTNVFMSDSINELAAALVKVQGQLEHAKKSSNNPFFKSKYEDLTEVLDCSRKLLYDNNLAIVQCPSAKGNEVSVTTMIIHVSGQYISSTLSMVSKDSGPQAIGSCITYGRRYGLKAMLGIASDDDDGNAASRGVEVKPEGNKIFDGKDPKLKGMVHAYMKKYGVTLEHMSTLAGQLVGKKMDEIEELIRVWELG